jgi:hypothetical protein
VSVNQRLTSLFYEFLTNQVKELIVYNCTNTTLSKLNSLKRLQIHDFNCKIYKLPINVYYIKFSFFKDEAETEIQEYLKLLFNNNPNLRMFRTILLKSTFLGFKCKNYTFELNSREEILKAINHKLF